LADRWRQLGGVEQQFTAHYAGPGAPWPPADGDGEGGSTGWLARRLAVAGEWVEQQAIQLTRRDLNSLPPPPKGDEALVTAPLADLVVFLELQLASQRATAGGAAVTLARLADLFEAGRPGPLVDADSQAVVRRLLELALLENRLLDGLASTA